jgi:hypothetical protein
VSRAQDILAAGGYIPAEDAVTPSSFSDGSAYRIEIPSVESQAAFEAVLTESARLGVTVHRVSQGSGIMLLTDRELKEMAQAGAANQVEVSLFVGPRAPWEGTAGALAPTAGSSVGGTRHWTSFDTHSTTCSALQTPASAASSSRTRA